MSKRTTVYFEPDIYKALKLKALETEVPVSDLINDAIKNYLSEDAEDLAAFEERAKESSTSFEDVVKKLKRNGKI